MFFNKIVSSLFPDPPPQKRIDNYDEMVNCIAHYLFCPNWVEGMVDMFIHKSEGLLSSDLSIYFPMYKQLENVVLLDGEKYLYEKSVNIYLKLSTFREFAVVFMRTLRERLDSSYTGIPTEEEIRTFLA